MKSFIWASTAFLKAVKDFMSDSGKTLVELEDVSGISAPTWSRLSRNEINISMSTYQAVCSAMKVDPRMFFKEKDLSPERSTHYA